MFKLPVVSVEEVRRQPRFEKEPPSIRASAISQSPYSGHCALGRAPLRHEPFWLRGARAAPWHGATAHARPRARHAGAAPPRGAPWGGSSGSEWFPTSWGPRGHFLESSEAPFGAVSLLKLSRAPLLGPRRRGHLGAPLQSSWSHPVESSFLDSSLLPRGPLGVSWALSGLAS